MRDAKRDATAPENGDDHSAESGGEAVQVSSLWPAAHGFSQRRLLNVLSGGVAMVVLLALGVHWLPELLAKRSNPLSAPSRPAFNAALPTASRQMPLIRGTGWKLIGPDWAQNIAFAPDLAEGYLCGTLGPGNAPILVAAFDVRGELNNDWKTYTQPTTGNSCQIAVSPVASNDVVLVATRCVSTDCIETASRVYRSHDGAASWSSVALPEALTVTSIAWTNATLFLGVRGHLPDDGTLVHVNPAKKAMHLLVSQGGGPLTVVDGPRLNGQIVAYDDLQLYSTGATLYVDVDTPCPGYCRAVARTSDEGAHWTQVDGIYADRPITIAAAQSGGSMLVGSVFRPSDNTTLLLRSLDSGATWQLLPALPVNPSTGGAVVFIPPDGSIYAFCFGDANAVYFLGGGAGDWKMVAPLPIGIPLAAHYNADGHVVEFWGGADTPTSAHGLEFYLLGEVP